MDSKQTATKVSLVSTWVNKLHKSKKRKKPYRSLCLQSHLMRQPRAWSVSSNSDESKNLRGARSLSFLSLLQQALRADSNPSTVTRFRWTKSTSWTRLRLLINMHKAVSDTEQLHKFICQTKHTTQRIKYVSNRCFLIYACKCFIFVPVVGFLRSKRAPRNPNHQYSRRVSGPSNPISYSRMQLQLNQHQLYSLALGVRGDLDVLAGGFVQLQCLLVHCSTIEWVGSSSYNLEIKLLNHHLQNWHSCTQKTESIRKRTMSYTFSIKNLPRKGFWFEGRNFTGIDQVLEASNIWNQYEKSLCLRYLCRGQVSIFEDLSTLRYIVALRWNFPKEPKTVRYQSW